MAAGAVFAEPLKAATAEPSAVTPALIEAARKEGKISFYTALELPTSERLGKAFEAKYPGIAVRVEERVEEGDAGEGGILSVESVFSIAGEETSHAVRGAA